MAATRVPTPRSAAEVAGRPTPSVTVGGHLFVGSGSAVEAQRAEFVRLLVDLHGLPEAEAEQVPMPGSSRSAIADHFAAYAAAPMDCPRCSPVVMSIDDKWGRRRAARRARVAPEESRAEIERPWCVDRSFTFWMLIGVPAVLALVGIVIIAAAVNMRAGYRGARVMLTVFAAPAFLTPISLLTFEGTGWALLALLPCALPIIATVLMWRPEASEYFRAVRGA